MKVFCVHPFRDSARERLLECLSPAVQLQEGPDLPESPDFEALVAGRPERIHLEASSYLSALVIPFAGLPDTTRELLRSFSWISVYNIHHNAAPTAEMALALLLAAAKFLLPYDRDFRKQDWRKRYEPSPAILLEGKRALILGYGHVGQRLGPVLKGLGMQVMAIRRDPGRPVIDESAAQVFPPSALSSLLPLAQVLVVTLPLTPQTQDLLGEAELAMLPRGSLLVNVGRGPIIDQRALFNALITGQLVAAGLDVWYNYPRDLAERSFSPPADYPFHELENVVISPHRAGHIVETEELRAGYLADLLNRLASGENLEPINLELGY